MPVIINARIYTGEDVIRNGFIRFNDTIEAVGSMEEYVEREEEVIDAAGRDVIPGMIDIHVHGGYDVDAMDADADGLRRLGREMLKEGVTSFFATTITQGTEEIMRALEAAGPLVADPSTTIEGIHLEGPFVNPDYAGAQPKEHIIPPDAGLFRRFQEASKNAIRLVTYAPELPGARLLEQEMADTGATGSAGHTAATLVENRAAGVRHGTHLYNQMRAMHHREPGTVGYCLLERDVNVEIIPDGVHSVREMVDLAYRLKGAEHLLVITDAMRAKGLADGAYELGGQAVTVENGAARLAEGNLAGSVLRMDEALRNIIEYTGCTLEEAVLMTSVNQAKEFGLEQKGGIVAGKDADLVVLDQGYVEYTIHRGTIHRFAEGGET